MLLGGRPLVVSSVHFDCGDATMGTLARRGVAAAGTIANFIAGALALLAFKRTNPLEKPHAAYFLWLFTTANLFAGAGYFLFSGVWNIGDWADVAASMPPLLWRPAMAIFGGAVYFFIARRSADWLGSLVGSDERRMDRARALTLPAYLAGGVMFCVAGLFNPVGPILIAISAAASSFGGSSGLLWLTQFLRGRRPAAEPAGLDRSIVWIVTGCVVSLIFVGILGPGLHI